MPLATVTKNVRSHSLLSSQRLRQLRFWPCLAILIVLIAYIASVTPGHVFISDDFAAYVMHAENLADGHPYSDIRYVPNPATVGFAPARGYPPVYPLILAPVYKIWGLNLRAMKVMTVLCFGVTLLALALIFEDTLPQWAICALILVVGFNINFWEQRNYLLSEFAYLMFSMVLLLALQKIYARLDPRAWRVGAAVLVSLLLYAAYGTRTIGIVLLPALVLTDVWKFRRPSRFLILSAVITLSLIVLQNSLLVSPKAYMNAQHISPAAFRDHISYYGKTLSYAWDNGNSKAIQIIFALFFTSSRHRAIPSPILEQEVRSGNLSARLCAGAHRLDHRDRHARLAADIAALLCVRTGGISQPDQAHSPGINAHCLLDSSGNFHRRQLRKRFSITSAPQPSSRRARSLRPGAFRLSASEYQPYRSPRFPKSPHPGSIHRSANHHARPRRAPSRL